MSYIVLEDLNFLWDEAAIQQIKDLWAIGVSLASMAKVVHRPSDEVALLIMDLARNHQITSRRSGVFGHAITHEPSPMYLYRCRCGITFGVAGPELAPSKRICPSCGRKTHQRISFHDAFASHSREGRR